MKHKLRTIFLVLVLMFSFVLNVNAETIKEDPKEYVGDAFVIGSSRFDASIVVTGTMASVAGAREMQIQYNVYNNYDFDPEDIKVYYYSGIDEAWAVLPATSEEEFKFLTEEESEKLEENLNIYFVNEEEKTLEMPYDIELEEGYELEFLAHNKAYSEKIKYENGKLIIPASVGTFEIYAVKESETEGEEPEEICLGNVTQEDGEFGLFYSVVSTYEDLVKAINAGAEYIDIKTSIDFPTALEISTPVEIYLESGVELTVKEDTAGDGVFHVVEGGNLTINGNGKINGVGKNKWNIVIFADGGDVTINGGYYTNIDTVITEGDTDSDHFDVIYAKKDSQVVINGGTFEGKTPAWILNLHDGSRETASITVKGGKFIGFNPADNKAEGEGTSFLAEGHKVAAANGEYTVSEITEKDVAIVNNMAFESLGEAIAIAPVTSTIKLIKDIELENGVVINKELTLDLNGKTLKAVENQADTSLFYVTTNGKLTVTGNGTINAASQGNDYSMAIWAYSGGEVLIENGTITNLGGKSKEDDGDPNNNELLYVTTGGKITINGGTIIGNSENEKWGTRYTLNQKDNSESEIIVKGGTFVNYNPADAYSEPTQPLSFLAEGYKSVKNGDEYTVMPYDKENVTDELELSTLLKNGQSVKIGSDIQLTKGLVINKELILDLNGKTLKAVENQADTSLFYVTTNGKLTVTGNGTINAASQGNDYSMAIWAYSGGEVIIENGTITNLGGKSKEDDGDPNNNELLYVTTGGKITINGGTIIGNSENEKWGTRYTLNQKDNSESEIIVKGGTFVNYNPADAYSEPTQPLSFLAEGYKSVKDSEKNEYTVVAE